MATQQFMFNATYNLPDRDIGFVIGTKGNKIQAIQRESGATVKLVKVPPNTGMQSYFHITSFPQDSVNAAGCSPQRRDSRLYERTRALLSARTRSASPSTTSAWSRSSAVTSSGTRAATSAASTARWAPGSSRLRDHQGGKAIRIVAKTEMLLLKVCSYYRANFPRFGFVDYNERWTPCEARTKQIEGAFRTMSDLKEGKTGAAMTHWHATLPDTEDFTHRQQRALQPCLPRRHTGVESRRCPLGRLRPTSPLTFASPGPCPGSGPHPPTRSLPPTRRGRPPPSRLVRAPLA